MIPQCEQKSDIKSVYCGGTNGSKENEKEEITMLEMTIKEEGLYYFEASIPLNYYGQTGRELYVKLKIKDIEIWRGGGVVNTYVYTLYTQLTKKVYVAKNSIVKIVIQDVIGKTYDCLPFSFYYSKEK